MSKGLSELLVWTPQRRAVFTAGSGGQLRSPKAESEAKFVPTSEQAHILPDPSFLFQTVFSVRPAPPQYYFWPQRQDTDSETKTKTH